MGLSIEDLNEVTIPKWKYEILTRESERLYVVRRLLAKNGYVHASDLKIILDVEETEGEDND